jgi:hypothetical protein
MFVTWNIGAADRGSMIAVADVQTTLAKISSGSGSSYLNRGSLTALSNHFHAIAFTLFDKVAI